MSWNFCPWCGHRVYQHANHGCIHVDRPYKPCPDKGCPDYNPQGHQHGHMVDEPCDCTVKHSLLREAGA